MSNHKRSIDGLTLFPVNTSQSSSDCVYKKKNHGARRFPVSNRNTIDLSYLDKNTCEAPSQVTSQLDYSLNSMNQRRSLRNTRLIPLKLGSAVTISDKSPTIPQDSIPPSSAMTRKNRPASISSSGILLLSEKEWKSVMAEVRLLYLKGDHKHCSMRCRLLLEGARDSFNVDPAYRVYLASYLASSLELMALTLPNQSPAKLPLYKEALACYQSAISDLEYAQFCANSALYDSTYSDVSSQSSSARSSIDSVFSQYSKSSSTTSVSPSEECTPSSSRKDFEIPNTQRKKKVSFSLSPLEQLKHYEDDYDDGIQSFPSSLLDSFPMPRIQIGIGRRKTSNESSPLNLSITQFLGPAFKVKSLDSSKLTHLVRYQSLLLGFLSQYNSRIKDLKKLIKEISDRSTFNQDDSISKSECATELIQRIQTGWARKRFDGSRYQQLCEDALGEL